MVVCSLKRTNILEMLLTEFSAEELNLFYIKPTSKRTCLTNAVTDGQIEVIKVLKKYPDIYVQMLSISMEPNEIRYPWLLKNSGL